LWGFEVDGIVSGSCPLAGFGISGSETPSSATIALVSFILILGKNFVIHVWNILRWNISDYGALSPGV